ncbi:C-type lectin mannose-binding isoform-like [Mercenaria mercenaria]|uniref:C-type lectin mannose-binding isoform-like n=1 Tax=Mercenaria mercenaria TaxID=6596 RepID=UPI00234E986D|nr:C-type lectin mannose-binding isoform-like [Mercenaria mercenaria]
MQVGQSVSGKTTEAETDLGICEGGVEGKRKGFCPRNYNMTTNGFCIKLYVTPKNHEDAEMVCQEDGGFLINIDSDLKYADVKSILNGFRPADINIGGRRKDSASQWEYKYGSGSGYFKWHSSSYPSNSDSNQCLALENYLWFDLSCTSKYPFLCEIPV